MGDIVEEGGNNGKRGGGIGRSELGQGLQEGAEIHWGEQRDTILRGEGTCGDGRQPAVVITWVIYWLCMYILCISL